MIVDFILRRSIRLVTHCFDHFLALCTNSEWGQVWLIDLDVSTFQVGICGGIIFKRSELVAPNNGIAPTMQLLFYFQRSPYVTIWVQCALIRTLSRLAASSGKIYTFWKPLQGSLGGINKRGPSSWKALGNLDVIRTWFLLRMFSVPWLDLRAYRISQMLFFQKCRNGFFVGK